MEGGPLTPEELIVNYAGGRVQELYSNVSSPEDAINAGRAFNPFAEPGADVAAACADTQVRDLLLSENPNAPGRG